MTPETQIRYGYDLIALACRAHGIDTAYGLMGDGNMLFMADLTPRWGIRVVQARHEGAALAMADGHSRVTGQPSFCMVTFGPGLPQLGTSLVVAASHHSPVVVFAGDSPTGRSRADLLDRVSFVESVGGAYYQVTSQSEILSVFNAAVSDAIRKRMPVVVSVPVDLQNAPLGENVPTAIGPLVPEAFPPIDEGQVAQANEYVRGAERLLVLAGRGATSTLVRDQLLQIALARGGLLGTTLHAKDLFAGQPGNVGVVGGYTTGAARAALNRADVVLAVGCSLSDRTLDHGNLIADADIVHIDLRPSPTVAATVRGDAGEALRRLLEAGADGVRSDFASRTDTELALESERGLRRLSLAPRGPLSPAWLATRLDQLIPDGAVVVVGLGHFTWFAEHYLRGRTVDSYVFALDYGCIGQSLPTAVGVAVASGRPVFLLEGDGSLLMHIQELGAVVREGIDMTIVVFDDAGYGAERHKLRDAGRSSALSDFTPTNYAAIAEGFGMSGATVETDAQLLAALRDGQGPRVIDVRIDPDEISDQFLRAYISKPASAS